MGLWLAQQIAEKTTPKHPVLRRLHDIVLVLLIIAGGVRFVMRWLTGHH